MTDLQTLITQISSLPSHNASTLLAYLAYKSAIALGIFFLAYHFLSLVHDYLTLPPHQPLTPGIQIDSTELLSLQLQISRIRDPNQVHIHRQDIEWLQAAIDSKKARDRAIKSRNLKSFPPLNTLQPPTVPSTV